MPCVRSVPSSTVTRNVAFELNGIRPWISTAPARRSGSTAGSVVDTVESRRSSISLDDSLTGPGASVPAGAHVPLRIHRAAAEATRGPATGDQLPGPVDERDDLVAGERDAQLGQVLVLVEPLDLVVLVGV